MINATKLAEELQVSRVRVSQYVAEGKLAGCYVGDGRARRFDLAKVAVALGRTLDPGQMMGNGAETKRALASLREADPAPTLPQGKSMELKPDDPDRYELARISKAEEEARKMRRQNAEAEGLFVLASAVEREVAKVVGQEVREFESVLKEGARAIADRLGVDFKTARQILMDTWRGHRGDRAAALDEASNAADLTAEEVAENI
ncbi:MAG: hypothetical protein V4747_11425 [Pseudomonadota bacterium]